jgi:membrane glycosyltransferase
MSAPSDKTDRQSDRKSEFERHASEGQAGLIREFAAFLVHNKKWWLAPIILALLLVGLLAVLSGTSAAPFIYTLF